MATCCSSKPEIKVPEPTAIDVRSQGVEVGLLTGGFDKPYAFGAATALSARGLHIDMVGSDEVSSPELERDPRINFLNLLPKADPQSGRLRKAWRMSLYYIRLMRYAAFAKPRIFHILWNSKIEYFDRTLLILYYKCLGKKIALTVHNVNAGKRDGNDSAINRATLRVQYRLMDHIFVHTEKMKQELVDDFDVRVDKISVIPFGINNSVPDTDLTSEEAKRKLGIQKDDKTILFFGAIRPYKGLEYLAEAFAQLSAGDQCYQLILAGEPKKGSEEYLADVQSFLKSKGVTSRVLQEIRYIGDEETELYFKAADVLALPYKHVFQSGVLFLAYSFGLPVVASDVGAVKEDVLEGQTGYVCRTCDGADLADKLRQYFESDLFANLSARRPGIREFAGQKHSWEIVGEITQGVYQNLLRERQ